MSKADSKLPLAGLLATSQRRAFVVLLLAAILVLMASSDRLHDWLIILLSKTEIIIRVRPVLGVSVFILLAALSAMVTFVSSAIIVPVGVYVWGKAVSLLLLWIGWILGGLGAYALSRYFGRPLVKALGSTQMLAQYEDRISRRAPFGLVLLFQIALPSELLGYLLGVVRYPLWKYLCALALAELPYAAAAIYLGAGFIEGRKYLMVGVGAAAAALVSWAIYALQRRVIAKRT